MARIMARALGAAFLTALAAATPAAAQETGPSGRLSVELNKLDPIDGGCRTFFLFRNQTESALTGFEMSLAVLDAQGVIDRLLTVDAAPLPAGRTTLKLFDIEGMECGAVGEILLHDLPVCAAADGSAFDCFGRLDLSSRAAATLSQ